MWIYNPMKQLKYLTPFSSSIEYIFINDESKFFGFYNAKIKYKSKNELYDYEIDKNLWDKTLITIIEEDKGLNLGKTMWGYVIIGQIIEYIPFNDIMR